MNFLKACFFSALIIALGPITFAQAEGLLDQRLKASPVMLSAAASIEAFAQDFSRARGQVLRDEFVGVVAGSNGRDVGAGIYVMAGTNVLSTFAYGCQLQADQSSGGLGTAQCRMDGRTSQQSYNSSGRPFKHTDFQVALAEAVALLHSQGGNPASISQVKAWQNRSAMEMVLTHGSGRSTLMCHYHGHHIDCHFTQRSGSGEPQ